MSKKEKFLVITENNSWEGESWDFYFKNTPKNRIFYNLAKEHLEGSNYSFRKILLTKEKIKEFKKFPCHGYLNTYNFMSGEYDFKKGMEIMKKMGEDRVKDPFYKGQYGDFEI